MPEKSMIGEIREQADYILSDPCIHKIIMYFKEEMTEKLRIALEPFKDKITVPLEIRIRYGDSQ